MKIRTSNLLPDQRSKVSRAGPDEPGPSARREREEEEREELRPASPSLSSSFNPRLSSAPPHIQGSLWGRGLNAPDASVCARQTFVGGPDQSQRRLECRDQRTPPPRRRDAGGVMSLIRRRDEYLWEHLQHQSLSPAQTRPTSRRPPPGSQVTEDAHDEITAFKSRGGGAKAELRPPR